MGGIELVDDGLVVDREPNDLDELALSFSRLLDDHGVRHVFVAGYIAILAGRARATQDIDVLVEPADESAFESIADELRETGYWGPAMPLDDFASMLAAGDNPWVARDGEMAPHLEVKVVNDEFDRASLDNAITARIDDETLPIGPFELQIPYKLYLGSRTDFEDALHLYALFEERLSKPALERWVERLDVADQYDRLRNA